MSWMRPPVAAGPISRKCRASKGERPACACERTGVNAATAAIAIDATSPATWRMLRIDEPPTGLTRRVLPRTRPRDGGRFEYREIDRVSHRLVPSIARV